MSRRTHTITVAFEVPCDKGAPSDAPSEVQAQARQLVVDALLEHSRCGLFNDDDEALIAEMLDVDNNPPTDGSPT